MTRIPAILIRLSLSLCVGLLALAMPDGARAQPLTPSTSATAAATDFSAQEREIVRRAPRRVPVYRGSNYPGPNAVRVCNAHYEQEFRPSGTVIVPRMHCYWRG